MASHTGLVGAKVPPEVANLLGNTLPQSSLTATGSTIADAYALTAGEFAEFGTVGSGTGALLPQASESGPVLVANGGSNALTVYPQAGQYMNGTLNGTFSVTNGKQAVFFPSGTHWIAILSA